MTSTQTTQTDARTKAREVWSAGDFDMIASTGTLLPAPELVRFADVRPGDRVLDVATGSGAVAIAARRAGATVTGLDVAPVLLEKAAAHCDLAGLDDIEWTEGDATAMDFPDASFDVVLSQFGHMFAADPDATTEEMLRVLKPGGRIAFATWPAEFFVGRMFQLNTRYVPPPAGVASPLLWGDPKVVRERLGDSVDELLFRQAQFPFPTLSPQHYRKLMETYFGPAIGIAKALQEDPAKLAAWRNEWTALVSEYFADNAIRHEYLMTRAVKR